MFEYFLRTPLCIRHTIHWPSARCRISNFYSEAFHVQDPNIKTVDPTQAAFILSICATAAFFWNQDAAVSCCLFVSVDDAARQANIWLDTAWGLLDQVAHIRGSGSLEEVQAYLILSELLYNMEGCSTRYRRIHNRTLTVSREISLHLIDAGQGRQAGPDNDALTEVKRRIWWHIASTDWLLSNMGGSWNQTYQVHPRHMMVHFPRNVNFSDVSAVLPADTITDMSYFLLRTRLAEVCRRVVDILPLGGCLPYDQILAVSQIFSDAIASIPPEFALDAPVQPNWPPSVVLDRQIIHLVFNARLARTFRPFLLIPDRLLHGRNIDPRCSGFRSLCLGAARRVLTTATTLLGQCIEASTAHGRPLPLMHRSGCVISHMFMACVIVATDPKLAPGKVFESEAEAIRRELADALHLLERAGEKSPIAATLVGKLVGVVKRDRVHGAAEEHHSPEAQRASEVTASSSVLGGMVQGVISGARDSNTTSYAGGTALEPQKGGTEQQSSCFPNPHPVSQAAAGDVRWSVDGGAGDFNPQMLDGIEWAGLMGAGSTENPDSWCQLFADLEAAFPGNM